MRVLMHDTLAINKSRIMTFPSFASQVYLPKHRQAPYLRHEEETAERTDPSGGGLSTAAGHRTTQRTKSLPTRSLVRFICIDLLIHFDGT